MTIDIQLVYIFALLFTSIVLVCMILISLYLSSLSKLSKLKIKSLEGKEEVLLDTVYKKLVERLDAAIAKIIDQITSKWSKEADLVFSKNIKSLEGNLVNKLNELYKNENDSLALYKKTKLDDFNINLSDYLKKVSKEVLKKEIDLDTHKKLISEALDKAIKNGLFN